MSFDKPYVPIVKGHGFNPNPVAGKIPAWANGKLNPKVIGSRPHKEFWLEQIDRCLTGYDTGGVHIPGRYYFYLNFSVVRGLRGPQYPFYVDSDLEFFKLVDFVKKEKKTGIVSIKARRKGVSEKVQGGILNYGARFIDGYRAGIAAGKETYTKGLKTKLESTHFRYCDEFTLNTLRNNEKEMAFGFEVKDPIAGYREMGFLALMNFQTMFDDPTKLEGEYFHDVVMEESGQFKYCYATYESIRPALEFGAEMGGTFYIYGCVCSGTKVWDNQGRLVNIEDLQQSQGILGFDGKQVSRENIVWMKPPAEKECVKIVTMSGRELKCSTDHPILWSNKGYLRGPHKNKKKATKFVEAGKIKVGDQIAIAEEVPLFGSFKMWEPRVIGWLISDGSYGMNKTPILSSCDSEIKDYVRQNFDTITERSHYTKDFKLYEEIRIKGITKYLRNYRIYGQTKDQKRLPEYAHELSRNGAAELLGGLFDTDGHVNDKAGGYRITLTASGKNLLFDVQLLLQKFGIHSRIDKINPSKKSEKGGNVYYRLEIRDSKSIIQFQENIGFIIRYKQKRLDFIANVERNKPEVIRKGKPVVMNKGVEGLRFERVVSIEEIGMQPVYNLNAGNTHTYIANGIVTHNTGGNILSASKDFKAFWDDADTYGLERLWIPGTRLYYPFIGMRNEDRKLKHEITGDELDPIKNLRKYTKEERIGMEDVAAAEEYILDKRQKYIALKNKTKLVKLNQNYPLSVEEAFTSSGSNNFNSELLYATLFEIQSKGKPLYKEVVLDFVMERNKHGMEVMKSPLEVTARPAMVEDPSWRKVLIFQGPKPEIKNLDVAGVDSYNMDQSTTSKSLGAMVVMRRGHKFFFRSPDIFDAFYPVCLYYTRPPRKEQFFNETLKIAVYYNLILNTMISAEYDLIIDYWRKNGGLKFMSPRPKSFDVPKTSYNYDIGAKMTPNSKPRMLALVQTVIDDYGEYIPFEHIVKDGLAYDEENIGTDWDSIDGMGLAAMRDYDMRVMPSENEMTEEDGDESLKVRWKEEGNTLIPYVSRKGEVEEKIMSRGDWSSMYIAPKVSANGNVVDDRVFPRIEDFG